MSGRSEYTWDDACRDLAMGSRLTYGEACAIRNAMESTGAHPHDAVQSLVRLYGGEGIKVEARPSLPSRLDPQRLSPRRREVYWSEVPGFSRQDIDKALPLTDEIAECETPSTDGFSLFLYTQNDGSHRSLLPVGRTGNVLLLPKGDNPGARMDAWPAVVESRERTPDRVLFKVALKVTGKPTFRIRVPS